MRTFLLVVHILAAGAWIGANITQVVVTPRASKLGGSTAAAWMRSTVTMGRVLYTPAAVLSLATGVALVLRTDSAYDFENAFVVIGVAMVVIGAFLGIRVFGPQGEAAADAFDAGDVTAARSIVGRIFALGLLDSLLLVVTVTAMVGKWGVGG